MNDDSSNTSSSSSHHQSKQPQAGANNNENASIRSALHFAVGRICLAEEESEDSNNNASTNSNAKMSSEAIAALTELVYQYTTTSLSNDLQCFSKHANRRTMAVDDVKLVARKDGQLYDALERFCERNDIGNSNVNASGGGAGRGKGGSRHPNTSSTRSLNSNTAPYRKKSRVNNNMDKKEFESLGLEQQRDKLLQVAMSSSSESSSSGEESEEIDRLQLEEPSKKQRKLKALNALRKKKKQQKRSSGLLNRFSATASSSSDDDDMSNGDDDDDSIIKAMEKRSSNAKKVIENLSNDSFTYSQQQNESDGQVDEVLEIAGKSPTCAIDLADDD